MRIAVSNCVAQNGGDAAIAFSIVRLMSEHFPQASIECHDIHPAVAQKYFPGLTWKAGAAEMVAVPSIPVLRRSVRLMRMLTQARELAFLPWLRGRRRFVNAATSGGQRRRLASYQQLDVVISTGGTYLIERYMFEGRLFEYRLAQRLGLPVFFYTQSLGPFSEPRNRRLLRAIFNRSPLVLLRDQRSVGHLTEIGVDPSRLEVTADTVFAEGVAEIEFGPLPSDRPLRIAVSVRAFPLTTNLAHPEVKRFASELVTAVTRLVRDLRCEITFISTCQGIEEYWVDDSALATLVADRLDADASANVKVDRAFHTPEDFRNILQTFDLAVATRMHAAIQALVVNTPVVPIAYEFKTQELFTRLGLPDFVLPIEQVTATSLVSTVKRLIDNFESLRAPLSSAVRRERAAALEASALMASRIRELVPDAPAADRD